MKTRRRPLRRVRRALFAAAALSATIGGLTLVLPAFALQLFGSAIPAGSHDALAMIAVGAVAVLALAGLVDFCRTLILLRAGLWLDHTAGAMLLEAAIARGADAATLRAQADATGAVRRALAGGRLAAALELPWAAAACALLVLIHPWLGAAALTVVGLSCSVCLVTAGRRRRTGRFETGRARTWLEAVAPQAAELSAMGASGGIARRWEHDNRPRVAKDYHLGWRFGLAASLARTLQQVGIAGVASAGAYLVIAESLAPAAVVAAALLVARAQSLLEQSIGGLQELREGRAGWRVLVAAERTLGEAARTHPPAAATARGRGGEISLEAVSTGHVDGQRQGLANINFRVEPGECIAVSGARGAGKSMLLRIMAGVALPATGRVALDGWPPALHQRSTAGRGIGYMGENCALLPGSVADNIAGFERSSPEAVEAAARRAGVDDVIACLPHGYDSQAAGAGSVLSARQARAVCLARALYGAPRAVILDEPELGANEAEIGRLCAVLEGLRRDGVTVVIATLEPRLLQSADRFAMMAGGTLECAPTSRRVAAGEAKAGAVMAAGSARAA